MTKPFISKPQYYQRDLERAAKTRVTHARLSQPDGTEAPALALFSDTHVVAVLPVDEAYRLASDIAQILTEYRQQH